MGAAAGLAAAFLTESGASSVAAVRNAFEARVLAEIPGVTVNGDVTVTMTRVTPDKPMSFSSMNGDIDVTLPADIKANVKMKSQRGEVYSDFDINMTRQPAKAEAAEKTEQGKYRIAFDKSLYGVVNGGGQEIGFNTFSGDIYIRKRK